MVVNKCDFLSSFLALVRDKLTFQVVTPDSPGEASSAAEEGASNVSRVQAMIAP